MTKVQGFSQDGGKVVVTQGLSSTTFVQKSFPSSTITVYISGTVTLATIYSDQSGTPKANPFTATSDGQWIFYTQEVDVDVTFSGGGITAPFTLSNLIPTPTFSVISFGAKCTVGVDDSAAFAAALATAPANGAIITVPNRTCNVASQININKANSALVGTGPNSKIQGTGVVAFTPVAVTANNVTVQGLDIISNGVSGTSANSACVIVSGVSGAKVLGNILESYPGSAIFLQNASSSIIQQNTTVAGAAGTTAILGSGNLSDNDISFNYLTDSTKAYGIQLGQSTTFGNETIQRNKIHHNVISGTTAASGVGHGITLISESAKPNPFPDNEVSDNTVMNTDGMGIYIACGAVRTKVTGNKVLHTVQVGTGATLYDAAIAVGCAPSVTSGFTATGGGASTITVAGQSWIKDQYATATIVVSAGACNGQTRVVASNVAATMTVLTAWSACTPDGTTTFTVTNPMVGSIVSHNTVVNDGGHSRAGIRFDNANAGEASYNVLTGGGVFGVHLKASNNNTVNGNQVSGTTSVGLYVDTGNQNKFIGNDVWNCSTGIEMDGGSDTLIIGNLIHDQTLGLFNFAGTRTLIYQNTFVSNGTDINAGGGTKTQALNSLSGVVETLATALLPSIPDSLLSSPIGLAHLMSPSAQSNRNLMSDASGAFIVGLSKTVAFANLPAGIQGDVIFCPDCKNNAGACGGTGSGALAICAAATCAAGVNYRCVDIP